MSEKKSLQDHGTNTAIMLRIQAKKARMNAIKNIVLAGCVTPTGPAAMAWVTEKKSLARLGSFLESRSHIAQYTLLFFLLEK